MSLLALAALVAVVVTLSPALVALIGGTVSPAIVAFITHSRAPNRLKLFAGGLVAVLVAFLASVTAADGSAVFELRSLVLVIVAFAFQQLSYSQLWRRLNLNRWRWLFPAFGIGKPPN